MEIISKIYDYPKYYSKVFKYDTSKNNYILGKTDMEMDEVIDGCMGISDIIRIIIEYHEQIREVYLKKVIADIRKEYLKYLLINTHIGRNPYKYIQSINWDDFINNTINLYVNMYKSIINPSKLRGVLVNESFIFCRHNFKEFFLRFHEIAGISCEPFDNEVCTDFFFDSIDCPNVGLPNYLYLFSINTQSDNLLTKLIKLYLEKKKHKYNEKDINKPRELILGPYIKNDNFYTHFIRISQYNVKNYD